MAFTCCILFTRYTREQNTTCKGHLAFQKATISLENDVHSFFFLSLTFITINVRHIQSLMIATLKMKKYFLKILILAYVLLIHGHRFTISTKQNYVL